MITLNTDSRLMVFVTPFASPAAVKHANKLLDCLTINCEELYVVCDARVSFAQRPERVVRWSVVPTLHYLNAIGPVWWSMFLWLVKLLYILVKTTLVVFQLRRKIDVVVCFLGTYYFPVLFCARLLGKKSISFEPGNDLSVAQATYERRVGLRVLLCFVGLTQWLNRHLAHLIVIESLQLVDQISVRRYIDRVRLGNLYVDTDFYELDTPYVARGPNIGFVGRLSDSKGVAEFVEAAISLRDPGISFYVIGDGPLRLQIDEKISAYRLGNIRMIGWLEEDELVNYLNRFRLVVMPTLAEGMSNVVLEAMACGTPVLATAVGGIPDVIHDGLTGFILKDRNPTTIAEAINAIWSRDDLPIIGSNARDLIVNNYSLGASSRKWATILTELAGSQSL